MKRPNLEITVVSALALVLLLAAAVPPAQAAGGSSASTSSLPETELDPRQRAIMSYNRGISHRDRAWELEEKAAAAKSDSEREKLHKKVQKEFGKAIRALRSAVEIDPTMYQGYSSLGYALRRTGDYEASLEAYNKSLEIEPRYAEAIEYRAEAYLGLNRVDEAKEAYMVLYRHAPARAAELMEAMKEWLASRTDDTAGVAPETVAAFSAWVDERAEVAQAAQSGAGSSW